MKNYLFISLTLLCTINAIGQSKNYKCGVTAGAHIQHYNGNLGNSFFKFNTACFAGASTTIGRYLNKSFDLNIGGSIGHFGYCQTDADSNRIVSLDQRCPGCADKLGMGGLRSLMIAGNIAIKYKLANDFFMKEDSKLAPYVYLGMGINHLSDNMKRQCVNVGTHLTVNSGAGVKYNINERFSVGYNLGLGCFVTKKVYYTNALANDISDNDPDDLKMERRKDWYMQNTLFLGINF